MHVGVKPLVRTSLLRALCLSALFTLPALLLLGQGCNKTGGGSSGSACNRRSA